MTRKLFHHDSYQTNFQAKIVDQYPDKGKYAVILDQTSFYPNAGGQICDSGKINGIPVIDVQELGGKIIHYLQEDIIINSDENVYGEIDWNVRFDHMQQHSGQHILSVALIELWQKNTLSFHMGDKVSTLDIPSTQISNKEARSLEERINQIIYENRPIHQYYAEENGKIGSKELRKFQKISEKLRIIEIEKYDLTACGGTHCSNTGEIGVMKITGWENRKDKTRISFLCGYRALSDYQQKYQIIKNLSNILTTGTEQLENKILLLTREQKRLNKECSNMEKRLLHFEAEELKKNYRVKKNNLFIVSKLFTEKSLQSLQQIAFMLANQKNSLIILGTTKPEPAICLSCSRDISMSAGELIKQIIIKGNGKGGGSEFLAMGKFKQCQDAKNAFKIANDIIIKR